jgi:hypothetical protein
LVSSLILLNELFKLWALLIVLWAQVHILIGVHLFLVRVSHLQAWCSIGFLTFTFINYWQYLLQQLLLIFQALTFVFCFLLYSLDLSLLRILIIKFHLWLRSWNFVLVLAFNRTRPVQFPCAFFPIRKLSFIWILSWRS